jgi:alpha-aminoadipic semialdehyde synthase
MRIIDDVRARYGTITGFSSVCGGLPAPDSANNPLKYKFSWSPMGVLAASQNDAKFRLDGETVMVRTLWNLSLFSRFSGLTDLLCDR